MKDESKDESTASSEWDDFAAHHGPGDIVMATVTKPLPFGCLVEAARGVPGLLRGVSDAQVNDRVEARIESLDSGNHRVALVKA